MPRPLLPTMPRLALLQRSGYLLACCAALFCNSLQAAEFRSVANLSILYDAPSLQSKKRFIAPAGMPVEIVANFDNNWSKVRDAQGDVLWIERKVLANKRTLITLRDTALYKETKETKEADSSSTPPLAQIEKGVVLEWLETANSKEWAKIKHADGSSGFIKTADVWGW